jgi:catechol 2,3-dioxygenase-like lactoylglutathione lyase family enzyme
MAKSTVSILLAATLIFSAFCPLGVHAQPLRHGGDYAQVNVPDIRQALSFFGNVLDCERIDRSASVQTSALMECQSGMVLELVRSRPGLTRTRSTPLRFFVADVSNASQWLRHEGARTVGKPVVATSGPDAGQTLINFTSPWGLHLQLVGETGDRVSALP